MKVEAGFQSKTRLRYPEWQAQYEEALTEFDAEKLPQKIVIAEAAIFSRAEAITASSLHRAELQAIQDALAFLRALKPANPLCS
jgi:isochorismate synthase EntC